MENKTNAFDWFSKNYLKVNPDKSNLLLTFTEKNFYENWKLNLKSSTSKKLLGAIIDSKLNFTEHVPELYKKAGQKLHVLHEFPVASTQIRLIMNAFFLSQVGYYLLVWKFHNRSLKNRVNRLQQRALRVVYKGTNSSIVELPEKENTFTIH